MTDRTLEQMEAAAKEYEDEYLPSDPAAGFGYEKQLIEDLLALVQRVRELEVERALGWNYQGMAEEEVYKIRSAERERCAKAVCELCYLVGPPLQYQNGWRHNLPGTEWWVHCAATAIWALPEEP